MITVHSCLCLLFILSSLLFTPTTSTITGNAYPVSTLVNAATTYQFEIRLSLQITSGGSLIITFPTQVGISSSISCTPIYGFSGTSATCSLSSASNIKLVGAFPSNDLSLIF